MTRISNLRPTRRWAAALVVASGSIACLGCEQKKTAVIPPPPEVFVAKPVTEEVGDFLVFTGSTRPTASINLRARVNGYLKEIKFTDGTDVKKGDVLFVIEQEPFRASLAAANAGLKKAEAALKLAEAEMKRTEPLVKRGALPGQELDVKAADRATAEAEVASAHAAITQAELNLAYTEILAPVSGRIGRHMVDVGNLIQAEMTSLSTLESYEPMYAYFSVGESDMLRLREEQAKTESGESSVPEVSLSLANETEFPHKGTLDFSDLGLDPSTGTQLRRGIFPNQDHSLVPGLFVRVRLPVGKPTPQLLITERAIGTDQRGEYVLVVKEKAAGTGTGAAGAPKTAAAPANNAKPADAAKPNAAKPTGPVYEVEYRHVQLGITVRGMRVVKKGLNPDEWIVVNGLQRARPGLPVTPKQTDQTVADAGTTPGAVGSDKAGTQSKQKAGG